MAKANSPFALDLTFPHDYAVTEPDQLPGVGLSPLPVHYIPGTATRPEHDGTWVQVRPAKGEQWVGVFAFGDSSGAGITRVCSTPDPRKLCVISAGAAYFVKPDDPSRRVETVSGLVRDARSIAERRLLLLAGFTHLTAYGPNGLAWKSPRLVWDDLQIENILPDRIVGTGYDPVNGERMRFGVDVVTGASLYPSPHPAF